MRENEFPALYAAADTAAKKAQGHFFWALGLNLGSLVIATILSVVNYPNIWFAVAQAVFLLLSLGLAIYLAYNQPQKIWYSTRALAESIKTVSWRYMMCAEPYNTADSVASEHFIKGLKKILETNTRACSHAVEMTSFDQISEKMRDSRRLSLANRKKLYLDDRIVDELKWYGEKAKFNKNSSFFWFFVLIALNGLALFFAIVKVAYPDKPYWPTDIFVSAASSVMAWLQTKRFQELQASYTLTALEISLLKETQPTDDDEAKFSSFVGDAENAFSREHIQWQARRDVE